MSKFDLSIILTCYNEGHTFGKSVSRIVNVLKKLKVSWEIVFVEDKSDDNTLAEIRLLAHKIKNCQVVAHNENQGRGKSVTDGIIAAKGDICGYLDVDCEVSENYIGLFVEEIRKGSDLAVGKRYYESGIKSLVRFLASKIYSFLVATALKIPISDTETGYKFFKRIKILPILSKVVDKHWFWDTEICARAYWAGLSISEIPVLFERREDKKSTVKLTGDTILYLRNLVRFRRQIPKAFR